MYFYLKWICGFAKAGGGVLVIGRNDKGVAVGVPNAKKLLEDLPNKVRDVLGIMVAVNLVEEGGKNLIEIRVLEKSHIKRAACLLFSDRPEQFVSGAWITIGFFVTDDDLRYQDEIHGNLFEQVEKTLELLHTKYLKAYISYEGLHRRETFLFPYAALREALLNAVVHKDYTSGIPIQISVYHDRLVIWNSGILPQDWTIKNLLEKHPSCPFNPLVANAFFRAGYIESWGRGIEKIRRECVSHGIEPPAYDSGMAGLMLTFHANPEHLANARETGDTARKTSVETLGKTLGKTPSLIVEQLRDDPQLTVPELALRLSKSQSAVQRGILKLQQRHLKRVGSRKIGYWKVIDHE